MPKPKKAYAWKDGNRVMTSLFPREAGAAVNTYDSETDALRDAQARGMTLVWQERAA